MEELIIALDISLHAWLSHWRFIEKQYNNIKISFRPDFWGNRSYTWRKYDNNVLNILLATYYLRQLNICKQKQFVGVISKTFNYLRLNTAVVRVKNEQKFSSVEIDANYTGFNSKQVLTAV